MLISSIETDGNVSHVELIFSFISINCFILISVMWNSSQIVIQVQDQSRVPEASVVIMLLSFLSSCSLIFNNLFILVNTWQPWEKGVTIDPKLDMNPLQKNVTHVKFDLKKSIISFFF